MTRLEAAVAGFLAAKGEAKRGAKAELLAAADDSLGSGGPGIGEVATPVQLAGFMSRSMGSAFWQRWCLDGWRATSGRSE